MKKILQTLLLLLGLCLPFVGVNARADETAQHLQVVVQHQFENQSGSEMITGSDIPLSLYDITADYGQKDPEKAQVFLESFSQMSPLEVKEYLAKEQVPKLETVLTDQNGKAHFDIQGNNTAYLIVQDTPVKGQTIVPLAFSLPLLAVDGTLKNMIELYTKPVELTTCPYFYKYGVSGKEQKPLASAEFVIYKEVEAEKQYLTMDGKTFSTSVDPLGDPKIKKYTSDENGLVLCDTVLDQGKYFFSEVKAPSGYSISAEAKQVAFEVLETGKVSLQGVMLAELVGGMVPSSFTEAPKVLNYAQVTEKEDDPANGSSESSKGQGGTLGGSNDQTGGDLGSKPSTGKHNGFLAQLGEKKNIVSMLGIVMLIIATFILLKQRKGSKDNE